MNNLNISSPHQSYRYPFLILAQFFLIIFVYHILKDLKDSLVITASDAGTEVIPFIKIWIILPFAVLASFIFSKLYHRYGRESTFYIFIAFLLSCYALFAFILYPFRNELTFHSIANILDLTLPAGCRGFTSMICNWIYSFFYLASELWAMMILSVLFWGYLNEVTAPEKAKSFYPMCVLTGNCAGILSGQTSHFLCQTLTKTCCWEQTLQWMMLLIILCGIGIIVINRFLSSSIPTVLPSSDKKEGASSLTFRESLLCIFRSKPLFCIALLVVGFGFTTNLVEVIWKETIKSVYPLPHNYNAYINQLTSIIGILAVCISLISRWMFKVFNWSAIALITPILLFIISLNFFVAHELPVSYTSFIESCLHMNPLTLVMTLGSVYYVLAMTAKYTIFDMCKEMAFLSISSKNERLKAKSVIDSVGSRLGKSGSSFLYQCLLIVFGSTTGSVPFIGVTAVFVIGVSVLATKSLGRHISKEKEYELSEAII